TVWRQADKYNVPRMCFVNKMDRIGADFYYALQTIEDRLNAKVAVIQLPIGAESDYQGIVDLITMKAWIWGGEELGAKWDETDIPADLADKAEEYREKLMDVLGETSDEIMEKYLGEEEISPDEIRAALREAVIHHGVVPVLNGTAFKNKGVQPLLNAICWYMPSPDELPPVEGVDRKGEPASRKPSDAEPFSALAFKIMTAPHVGKLTYFRVYSGELSKGDSIYNSRTGNKERLGRVLEMHANDQIERESVHTGDIVAGIGIKDCRTGDSLSDPANPIVLESLEFPDPVIEVAVEPKTKADQDKMSKALYALSEEDPTFRVKTDEETGQTLIAGMGELHLEVIVDRMLREFKVDATVGKPQVAYRETITAPVDNYTYLHKKQTGGTGQYAKIIISLEPSGPGGGFKFADEITGGRIPKEYIPSVGHGVVDAMTNGTLAGFPMVDINVKLIDGDYHDVDSSEMAFKIAGTMGFKEAVRKGSPVLLEPIMAVEVTTPEDYMGDVIGDLNSRRGKVGKMEQRGKNQIVNAEVPLAEMFGYSTDLRSKTQGRATYSMQFHSYQQTPRNVQEEIVARVTGQ
ncbi:MAG: elongation factor G, partial [Microthrixaceae bacterium]|nr:elongation factor G [Microthrixaceae bacterium]